MNDQSPQQDDTGRLVDAQDLSLAASSQARRRLLRAVGATGAIAGIGLPLSAHATARPYCIRSNNNYHATASAVGSMIGSATGGAPPIAGYNCGHYRNASNWGTGYTNGRSCALSYNSCANYSTPVASKLRFWQVFEITNPGSGQTYRFCEDILNNDQGSNEAVWLTALFNANKRNQNGNVFAYTPTQVLDLYRGQNPLMGGAVSAGLNVQALTLFRDYLSSLA